MDQTEEESRKSHENYMDQLAELNHMNNITVSEQISENKITVHLGIHYTYTVKEKNNYFISQQ